MGIYNITGWSGGGRRPLTYNLMPGQFRNTRVNVFPSQTIINNNIGSFGGCYDYHDSCCCGGGGNSTPKWMNWMMGLGMGTSLLGNIMSMFGVGGRSSTEGAGEKKADTKPDQTDLNNLKTLYKDKYNIAQMKDGSFVAKPKDGGKAASASTANELMELLEEQAQPKPATTTAKTTTASTQVAPPPTDENPFKSVLFEQNTTYTTAAAEEKAFNTATGQNPYKITQNSGSITITEVIDKGNNTSQSGRVTIDLSKLSNLADGQTLSLGKFKNKTASAEKLGDYIRLKIGDQTYIVGADNKAYQYKSGNIDGSITGYSEFNWKRLN